MLRSCCCFMSQPFVSQPLWLLSSTVNGTGSSISSHIRRRSFFAGLSYDNTLHSTHHHIRGRYCRRHDRIRQRLDGRQFGQSQRLPGSFIHRQSSSSSNNNNIINNNNIVMRIQRQQDPPCYRYHHHHHQHRQQYRQSSSVCHHLRVSYFSSTADILLLDNPDKKTDSIERDNDDDNDDDDDDDDDDERLSQTLAHLHVQQQLQQQYVPNNSVDFLFLYELNQWYETNHPGTSLKDAFVTEIMPISKMLDLNQPGLDQNGGAASPAAHDDDDNNNDVVVAEAGSTTNTDFRRAQVWTATFTCPIDKEMVVVAGQLPGFVHFGGKNYYSKKKMAIQATAKEVLALKATGGSDTKGDDDVHKDDYHFGIDGVSTRIPVHHDDGTTVDKDADSAKNTNGQNYPGSRLSILYGKHFKVNVRSNHFQFVKQSFSGTRRGGVWWTASFTCPITGQVYTPTPSSSATTTTMTKSVDGEDQGIMCIKSVDQENGVDIIWFRRKSDALHSTASAAIEAIDWENTELTTASPMKKGRSAGKPGRLRKTKTLTTLRLEESMGLLASWYRIKHDINDLSDTEDYFVATHSGFKGTLGNRWTASFICPVTGERFDSGTLCECDVKTDNKGVHWYSQKDVAMGAAALRAYDMLNFRETGKVDPRFCREHPAKIPPSLPPILETTLIDHSDGDGNADMVSDMDDVEDGFEDEEDEYIVEVIPQSHGLDQNLEQGQLTTTPLDIIAQAWIESTRHGNDIHSEQGTYDATLKRQNSVERALKWISQWDNQINQQKNDRTQFDLKGEMGRLKIANLMLSSLAEAHQRLPFETEPTGVEVAATAILDRMWSSYSSAPNALTYAFYLKCLEGESCEKVAKKAQDIVEAMEEGSSRDGRVLPTPTVDVYCSLAQLKAQAGIKTMDELRLIIDPNRDLYLAELSAMAHDSTTFDAEYAMKCVRELRAIAESKSEPPFQPNIELFNAPLRWSGGELMSRLDSRPVPWDVYSDIFRFGFKDWNGDDLEVKEAREIEKWIEMMTSKTGDYGALSPNIETYESIIQAWVRSGSLEGLQHAEVYALKLCNGDYYGVEPRIHTFYPILSAWTYSGAVEAPQSIQSWKKRLRKISLDSNPFLSFSRLLMLSECAVQKQLLHEPKREIREGIKKSKKRLMNAASRCEALLQKMLLQHRLGNEKELLSPDLFLLSIQAWNNAAGSISCETKRGELEECVEGTERILKAFEQLLLFMNMSTNPSHQSELVGLLDHAPAVYGAHLATIKNLNGKLKQMNPDGNSFLDNQSYLSCIEKLVRRSEEYRIFLGNNLGTDQTDTMSKLGGNQNSFPFPSDTLLEIRILDGWLDCFGLALDVIEENYETLARNESYFIRVCLLIARTVEMHYGQSSVEESNRVKNRVIALLTIFKNANITDRKVLIDRVTQAMDSGNKSPVSHQETSNPLYSNSKQVDREDNQREPSEQPEIVRNNVIARRKRVRGSDYRSQQLGKAPNRSQRRRPRAHQ